MSIPSYKCKIEFDADSDRSKNLAGGPDGKILDFPSRVPCIGESFQWGDHEYEIINVFWLTRDDPNFVAILKVKYSGWA